MTTFNVPGFPTILDEVANNIEGAIKRQWRNFFSQLITPEMKRRGWNFITDFFQQDGYPKTFLVFSFVYKNEEGYTAIVRGNTLETYAYLTVKDPSDATIEGDIWLREPLVIPYHAEKKVKSHKDPNSVIPQKTYYISGHLSLTNEEFAQNYRQPILDAIKENAAFVVGDAPGADIIAQRFLVACAIIDVTVYHMLEKPRNNVGFKTIGGFNTDTARDEAMTAASNADIAWVRSGREDSGTAKNLARRKVA
jgi:hypothetical protein